MDEALKRKLEPSTSSIKRRSETIEKLAAAGITVAVLMSPVFPALTDTPEQMEEIVRAAADAGASYFLADILQHARQRAGIFPALYADNIP